MKYTEAAARILKGIAKTALLIAGYIIVRSAFLGIAGALPEAVVFTDLIVYLIAALTFTSSAFEGTPVGYVASVARALSTLYITLLYFGRFSTKMGGIVVEVDPMPIASLAVAAAAVDLARIVVSVVEKQLEGSRVAEDEGPEEKL